MQIYDKPLGWLTPYENNPRNNDEAVEPVANSISEFGFKVPIVATSDGEIINGHTRWKAAKKLKLKTVPVIIADDLTEEQVRAFRLADNKVAEIAQWDIELLLSEIESVDNLDMTLFGFTDSDYTLDDFEDEETDTDISEDEIEKRRRFSFVSRVRGYLPTRTTSLDVWGQYIGRGYEGACRRRKDRPLRH